MNQDKLYQVYITMNWSSNAFTHYYFSSWWGVMYDALLLQFMWGVMCSCITTSVLRCNVWTHVHLSSWTEVVMHYYFSSWWGVHDNVHDKLLHSVHELRCTCDKVCPGSYITTSVHGEVYMSHVHLSSWTEVVMYVQDITTSVHHEVYMCNACSHITTSVHGEVYMCSCITTSVHGDEHVFSITLQFMVRCTCVKFVLVHHYYFSSWWGVHVMNQFVLVHALLLQFMVRCTCEVYMCSHYYFSSWWGVHVITFVLVHALLLQFMVRTNLYHMYTSVHELNV